MGTKGAEIIIDAVLKEGMDYAFGLCGHGIIGLMDALHSRADRIKTITARHEAIAGFMAEGYYRVKHKPALVFSSCGPGSMNIVIALQSAFLDSSAFLHISGNVATDQFNRTPFQETGRYYQADYPSVIRHIVKRTFQPTRPEMLPLTMRLAMKTMLTGRPGPVNIDVPWNVFVEETDSPVFEPESWYQGIDKRTGGNPDTIRQALRKLISSKRPCIIAGHGAILSEAAPEVLKFAESFGIPVVTTPNGAGIVDRRNPLSLGVVGRNGTYPACEVSRSCDHMLALGVRFDDRLCSGWVQGYTFNIPPTELIQVDIDPEEIGRNYPVSIGLNADIKTFMEQCLAISMEDEFQNLKGRSEGWLKEIEEWKLKWNAHNEPNFVSEAVPLKPERIIADMRRVIPDEGIVVSDVGNHHNWVVQFMDAYAPQTLLHSWGAAAMGFGVCGALGAKIAAPEKPVVAVVGDGGFTMWQSVLCTAVEYSIPVVWVVWNNYSFLSIRDLQRAYFEKKELATSFCHDHFADRSIKDPTGKPYNPDFVAVAKAHGADAIRVEKPGDIGPAIEHAIKAETPYVVDVIVDTEAGSPSIGTWEFQPFPPPEPNFVPRNLR